MRPPLTREDLTAIQERNHNSPDVRALLWEIRRLRAVLLRSHDYFRQMPTSSIARTLTESYCPFNLSLMSVTLFSKSACTKKALFLL